MEQLTIVGKRSGDGFVTHKAMLVNAMSRGLAERLMLLDFTIGHKGFLGYIKALAGSNVVKVVPASGSANGEGTNGHKKLRVVCKANTSYLDDLVWVGDKTPMTLADVRVSPDNAVKPNIGSLELSEALLNLREEYLRWGKDKIVLLLKEQGFRVSTSMVGRIIRRLKDRGVLKEPVSNHISAGKRLLEQTYAIRKPKDYEVVKPGDLIQYRAVKILTMYSWYYYNLLCLVPT